MGKHMTAISAGESQIMEALWSGGPLTMEELTAKVGPPNGWETSTVRTLVFRLQKKKALESFREEGRYLYRPLIERAAYVQTESQGLLDRLFGGRLTPMVNHFAEHGSLTADEVEQLKALVEKLEKKHD